MVDEPSFVQRLADDRARAEGRVEALERQLARVVADAQQNPPDDEHDPDGATVGFERAQLAALLREAREHVAELASAEARYAAGISGTCVVCGGAIGAERLAARPRTDRCVACAARG